MSEYSLSLLILYFFALCGVFAARFVDVKIGNILAVVTALIAFGVAGSRPDFFPDVDTYELMYDLAASGDFNNPAYWFAHGEPGFKVLSYLISAAGFSYSGFLMIMAYISCLLLFYTSRISGVPIVYLWFAYFSFHFIIRDLGVIRMGIASHLIVIFFLQRAILWQAVVLVTASLTFQYFAFIAALAKPLSRFNINWRSLLLLFLITFLAYRFLSFENLQFLIAEDGRELVNRTRANTLNPNSVSWGSGGQAIILPVIRNLICAFFLFFLLKNESKLQYFRLWIWAAFLSGAVYIMAADVLVAAQRFSAYFAAVVPLAMAYIMKRRSIRNDSFFLVVLFSLLNFASIIYYYGTGFRFFT